MGTTTRRASLLLALGVGLAGALRGLTLPATTDAGFLLLGAGNALLRGTVDAYAVPPGGLHSPPLGAVVTAGFALFVDSPEAKILLAGAVLLGITAALVAAGIARRAGLVAALAAAAFVILPPTFAAAFTRRPDAALAAGLVAAALLARLRGVPGGTAAIPAWIGTLASPWAAGFAALLAISDRDSWLRPATWIGPLLVAAVLLVLTNLLPEGARSEFLVATFGPVTLPGPGIASTLATIRFEWLGGILLLGPVILGFRGLPHEIRVAWLVPLGLALLLAGPGEFRGATAVFVPPAAIAVALAAHRWPDAPSAGRALTRPLLVALSIPLLLFAGQHDFEKRRRTSERVTSARASRVAVYVAEHLDSPGPLLASEPGTVATFSERATIPLLRGDELAAPWPLAVVFARGFLPTIGAERRLLEDPRFFAGYAPEEFTTAEGRPDGVWRLVRDPAAPVPPDYARDLAAAFATLASSPAEALPAFARAADQEPPGFGLAHEQLGIALEHTGRPAALDSAGVAFERAIRDPQVVRARGYLADRLLSRGEIARADTLLAQAQRLAPDLPAIQATSARLFALADAGGPALEAAQRAALAAPNDPVILVNYGTLLWASGEHDGARTAWGRAQAIDPQVVRFLGKWETAADSMVAPPLLPIFSRAGFLTDAPRGDASDR